jgi:hypothetical protein
MELAPRENPKPTSPHEDIPNPISELGNINNEIDGGLRSLTTLIKDLISTKEPS